ncbi:MAG: cobalamin biosynthesis protein, partial [Thermodesulfovibrionales bacterium]|nr:cobalamin biosynthesis protein [Thermodesulfovibrionales bacterium]
MTDFLQYLKFSIQDSAFSLLPALLMLAFLLDLAIGDPRWLPHPVRIMGSAISRTEIYLRKLKVSEKFKGILLVTTIVGMTFIITWFTVN